MKRENYCYLKNEKKEKLRRYLDVYIRSANKGYIYNDINDDDNNKPSAEFAENVRRFLKITWHTNASKINAIKMLADSHHYYNLLLIFFIMSVNKNYKNNINDT